MSGRRSSCHGAGCIVGLLVVSIIKVVIVVGVVASVVHVSILAVEAFGGGIEVNLFAILGIIVGRTW